MSQENVELSHQVFDAFNRRDLGAYLELMDAEVEAVPLLVAMTGDYHGHAGIRRWWENLLDVFPDFAVEPVEVRDLGNLTLAALRFGGRGAGSETPFEQAVWQLGEWRDGKCVWWRAYETEAKALEAAGLGE
jgi:ketosteroid isomerase-like protein